jgi:hypothetical protein
VSSVALVGVACVAAVAVLAPDNDQCRTSSSPVVVDLKPSQAAVADHVLDAVEAGQPRVVHLARDEARQNRRRSLAGIPTRKGFDRDEYPPASSDEGGGGADVRYVSSSVNRSAGQLMGHTLRGFCDGQSFVIRP